MTEKWKDVVGYEGYYEISNRGCVRTVKTGRIRKLGTSKSGYKRVKLRMAGTQELCSVHVLVLDAFVGMRNDGEQTNHKDGVKDNNRLRNLEWCTASENNLHKTRVLKRSVGQDHYCYGKFGSDNNSSKKYVVISPDGTRYDIKGLRKFCREHKIHDQGMCHVASGKQKTHKGWRCRRV